jgi:hypothetical protein
MAFPQWFYLKEKSYGSLSQEESSEGEKEVL